MKQLREQHEHHSQRFSRTRMCPHPAQLRLLEHRLHTHAFRMLTGASVLCSWGVIPDFFAYRPKHSKFHVTNDLLRVPGYTRRSSHCDVKVNAAPVRTGGPAAHPTASGRPTAHSGQKRAARSSRSRRAPDPSRGSTRSARAPLHPSLQLPR